MSVTVLAVPYALAWVVGTLSLGAISVISKASEQNKELYGEDIAIKLSNNEYDDVCDDVQIVSEANFMEKSFETPFMDKEILLKTLEEHGVQDIVEEFGKITGRVETYSLSFEKMEPDKPYFLTMSYLAKDKPEEKLEDLGSEYSLNVQEDAYLNIVEKLKENNMQIEDEEVMDDNTIVLTINLEG